MLMLAQEEEVAMVTFSATRTRELLSLLTSAISRLNFGYTFYLGRLLAPCLVSGAHHEILVVVSQITHASIAGKC